MGKKLDWLPSKQMNWSFARKEFPNAEVLSLETGYKRSYQGNAYESYKKSSTNIFPVDFVRDELERKDWVLGVEINGKAKAYPMSMLTENDRIEDTVGDTNIRIKFDENSQLATVTDVETKNPIPSVRSYWFAWQAFYPDTLVCESESDENRPEELKPIESP